MSSTDGCHTSKFGSSVGLFLSLLSPAARPNLPPDPHPQAHTPDAPYAKQWSDPQEICLTASKVSINDGIQKWSESLSGTPALSANPIPNRPLRAWPHVYNCPCFVNITEWFAPAATCWTGEGKLLLIDTDLCVAKFPNPNCPEEHRSRWKRYPNFWRHCALGWVFES